MGALCCPGAGGGSAATPALDADAAVCNLFEMEWPPRSGRMQSFPELDRAAWFDVDTARRKAFASQGPFFDRLLEALA